MTRRHFASAAAATTLAGGINPSAVTVTVGSVIGWPVSYPYTAIIDYGTASEEVVLVTAGSGTTLTITRGYDSTTGLDHSIGATFIHGASAIDFDEANQHVNATTGVHGTVGELVGTTDGQSLTNKNLSSATNVFPASLATDVEVTAAVAALAVSTSAALTAALLTLPQGKLGYAEVTANQAGITTIVDLTGLATTVTVGTGRRVRISAHLSLGSSVAADVPVVQIQEGATLLNSSAVTLGTAGNGAYLACSVVLTPTAASHTYKLTLQRAVGSGSITLFATATTPSYILVEDIGLA